MVFRSQGFIDPNSRDRLKVLFEAGALPGYVIIAAPKTPKVQLRAIKAQLLAFSKKPEAKPFLEKLGYDGMLEATEESMKRLDPYLEQTEAKLK
jgi:ABC-type phosphate/phosphonate transport system substrate-binding protein